MVFEQYGLDPVPEPKRNATWADMFVIWFGVSMCLPSFIVGALLVPTFSWDKAVEINFVGNLAVGALIVLGGYFGTKTGFPAVIYGKHVFGHPLGHWLPTSFLLLSTLGWFAVMTAMTGAAINEILKAVTGWSFPLLMTVIAGLLNASTAVMGYEKIRRFSWMSIPLLCALFAWMTLEILSLPGIPEAILYQPTGSMRYGEGVDLVIGGFLSGALVASDFSRYAKSNVHNWAGTLPGTFLMSFILGLVGILSTAVTGDWNPVSAVRDLGMGIPALVFILLSSWTTNDNVLYSSGLAMTNLLPRLGRWKNTLVCGAAGTALAVAGAADLLQPWLLLLSNVISPMLGVVLTDFFILKRTTPAAMINLPAVAALAAGIFLAKISPPQYVSSAVGLASSSAIYIVLVYVFKQKKALWEQQGPRE